MGGQLVCRGVKKLRAQRIFCASQGFARVLQSCRNRASSSCKGHRDERDDLRMLLRAALYLSATMDSARYPISLLAPVVVHPFLSFESKIYEFGEEVIHSMFIPVTASIPSSLNRI